MSVSPCLLQASLHSFPEHGQLDPISVRRLVPHVHDEHHVTALLVRADGRVVSHLELASDASVFSGAHVEVGDDAAVCRGRERPLQVRPELLDGGAVGAEEGPRIGPVGEQTPTECRNLVERESSTP
eukprot:CAMPEP_0202828610 /NCGR_PEP_ID=MMETSP1389-20130828/15021_1 /ASSEMBLY_ACC=CAM_ASM_000865 /TAXON_ID=302021 /ORGANISM="Rhodomonas sp., Strain CCMP768" /LENGTH=126 /DNA_ID=CAMNT_0049502109 /DNA_START=153 /DNA_END=530 /DNA_ORIENTATION=+